MNNQESKLWKYNKAEINSTLKQHFGTFWKHYRKEGAVICKVNKALKIVVSTVSSLVPERRLELLQVLPHRLLRPARLPISPPGLESLKFKVK